MWEIAPMPLPGDSERMTDNPEVTKLLPDCRPFAHNLLFDSRNLRVGRLIVASCFS